MSKIIAGIIEKYLGEFVVLDKEKFDISLFTETRIQNVAIRPDLLSQFVDSPIYGHVETISINPNVGNNKPLSIKIKGIYIALLLTNGDTSKSIDPIEAKRRRLAANDLAMQQNYKDELALSKMSASELQERALKQQQDQSGARKDTNEVSIAEKFARRMLKKISLAIEGLHVRIETDGACIGIVMKSLLLESNTEIKPTDFLSPRNTFILDGLGIYIDRPNGPGESCPTKQEAFVRYLSNGIKTQHDYILSPYTTGFSLSWALKNSSSTPLPPARYALSGNMGDISIVLSKEQYNRLFIALNSLKQQSPLPDHIKNKRPKCPVKMDPKAWFRYAGEAVLFQVADKRKRRSAKFLNERFAVKKKYCALYKSKLKKKIRIDESKELEKLDMMLDINDIMFFRSFAVAELNVSFNEKMKGITSSHNKASQLMSPLSSPTVSPAGSFTNSFKKSFGLDKKSSGPLSLDGSGSGSSNSLRQIGGFKGFSLLKEIKMGANSGDDDDDDDMIQENKSQSIFSMNVTLMSFNIILQNGSSMNGTPLLTLKADTIRVNLTMPTQLTTNVNIKLSNLIGTCRDPTTSEVSTLITYVPEVQQRSQSPSQSPQLQQPFIGVLLSKKDDFMNVKATVRPMEIVLTERTAEHLAHFLLPPDEVNVMELGNKIFSYIYMYVLLLDDSLTDTNITPGPGKMLEKLGIDATVKELTIRVKSAENSSELDIGIGQINAKSEGCESRSSLDQRRSSLDQRRTSLDQLRANIDKKKNDAGLTVTMAEVYVGVPRREDPTSVMHIIPPFNLGAKLSLPIYSSKKAASPITIGASVETVRVALSEEVVYALLDLEKSFCRILVPIICSYLSSLAKHIEFSGKAPKRLGEEGNSSDLDSGPVSATAAAAEKGNEFPIKINGTVRGVTVSWLGHTHDMEARPIANIEVSEIGAVCDVTNGSLQGDFGIPWVRIRDKKEYTQLEVSEITASVFAPETGTVRAKCTITAVESQLETSWLAELVGSSAEVMLCSVRVISRDIISVVLKYYASLTIFAAQAHKLFSVELSLPGIRLIIINGQSAVAIEVAGVTALLGSPHLGITTTTAMVGGVRICSGVIPSKDAPTVFEDEDSNVIDTFNMPDLVRVGKLKDLPKELVGSQENTTKRSIAVNEKEAVRLDATIETTGIKSTVRVNDVIVGTRDIVNVVGFGVRTTKELLSAIPDGFGADLIEFAKTVFSDFISKMKMPDISMDVGVQNIAVDLVPPYAPEERYKICVPKVSYISTPDDVWGVSRVEGVEMLGGDIPMLGEPLTITAKPSIRIDKVAKKIIVGMNVSISPVKLVIVPEHIQGLMFLGTVSTALLLAPPLWEGNLFPSFLHVELDDGVHIPNVCISIRTSPITASNSDVLNVCLDDLAITGSMSCDGQSFAITGSTLVVKPANENSSNSGLIMLAHENSTPAMRLLAGRKKTDDSVILSADVDVGGLTIETFDNHTIFRGLLPFAKRIFDIGIDFRKFHPINLSKEPGKRAVVLKAGVSVGNGLTLRYDDFIKIRVSPITVAAGARANGAIESITLKTNIDDGVLITDKYDNTIVAVSKIAVNVDSCLDVIVSGVNVTFWPGILSNTILPIVYDMGKQLLAAVKEENEHIKKINAKEPIVSEDTESGSFSLSNLRVPLLLDKYTVNVAVENIVVDVRRALKADDGRVVLAISAMRIQPPSPLECGKPLISSIFTDTRLDIDRVYTVCNGFTQGLGDNMHIAFSITPDNDLVFRTIQLTFGFGRNHLAAFYSLAYAFKQIPIPPLSRIIPPELLDLAFKPQTPKTSNTVVPKKNNDIHIRCELPEITLAWVDCFTCTISNIEFGFVGTMYSSDIDIKVRSITIADNHVDKMAAHPILSLLEEADGSPAVGIHIGISEETIGPVLTNEGEDGAVATLQEAAAVPRKRRVISPTIRMSIIDVFATPEIIDTTLGDIKWMQNYNIRVYNDDSTTNEESVSKEDDEKSSEMKQKIAEAFANGELRVAFNFMISGISAHFYEDYTALYCIGAFGVSLERFAVVVATPSTKEGQKIDIEEFDIAVRDMRVAAGFRCSSSGEEEGGPRTVSLRCPHVKVWITDGMISSLTIGMDSLNIDVQAELLTSFVEHASRIKLNVSLTRSKNVVRHADMNHAPWDIDSASINEVEEMDVRPPGILDVVAEVKKVLDKGMSAKITFGDINISANTLTGYSLILNVAGFECVLDDIELRRIQLLVSAQVKEHDVYTQLFFPWKIVLSILNNMDTPSVQVQMENILMVEINPQGLKCLCFVLDSIRKGFPENYEPAFVNAFDIPVFSPPPQSPSVADFDADVDSEDCCPAPKEVKRTVALKSVFTQELLDIKGTVTSRPTVGSDLHEITVAGWGTRTWEGGIPPGVSGLTVRNEANGKDLCLILKRRMSPSGEAGAAVESLLNVYNKTDFDLSLAFAEDSRMELRPRSRAHAPPQFIANAVEGKFCVEASNTRTLSKHSVSETQKYRSAPVALKRHAGKRYLEELRIERPDSTKGKKRWFFLTLAYDVSPQKIASIGDKTTFFASRAIFLPTLYIENSLPTQVTIELSDTKTYETVRVSIDSGSTTSILDIQRKEAINIMGTITVSTHPDAPVLIGTIKTTLKYPSSSADPSEQLRPLKKNGEEVIIDVTFQKRSELNGIICAGLSQDETTGIWKIRLFSRYILMNTTGINLEIKNGSLLPLENTDNSVFLANFRPSKGMYLRKAGMKEWSPMLDVEYGYDGVVNIPGVDCSMAFKADPSRESFGVSLRMFLRPLYTIYNDLGFTVHVRQPLSKFKERSKGMTLENQTRADIYCRIDSDASGDNFFTIKAEGFLESEPIDICAFTENRAESIYIHSSKEEGSFKIIHIESKNTEDVTRIALYDDDGTASIILQNYSTIDLNICQKGYDKHTQTVPPNKQIHFAWDCLDESKFILSVCGQKNADINISNDKKSGKFIIRDEQKEKHLIKWETSTENGITIVKFIPRPLLSTLIESEAFMPCHLSNPTGERYFNENDYYRVLEILIEGIGLTYTLDDSGHNIDAAFESIDISNRLPDAAHKKIFTNKVASTSKVRNSNLVEFSLKSKLRKTDGEIHDISKLYGRLSPISLSLDEELVLTLILLVENAIPKDLLKPKGKTNLPKGSGFSEIGSEISSEVRSVRTTEISSEMSNESFIGDAEKSAMEKEEEDKNAAAAAAAATAAAAASAPFYVRDLSISGISLNFSCYPARSEFKKQFAHVKMSKRVVSIINLVYKILGNFSNSSIVVTPLQYEEMMYPNGEKFQKSIVSHFVPQLLNKIVESARGTGLLSSVTFLAKAAAKAGLMNAIFK